MLQQIGQYGSMDKPEEQKKIDVNLNPVEIVKSTYQLWLPIAKKSGFSINGDSSFDVDIADMLYNDCR